MPDAAWFAFGFCSCLARRNDHQENKRLKRDLQAAKAALAREAEQRIKDCEDRNAHKRRADVAELRTAAALRELERASDVRVNRTTIIGNVHLILQGKDV